MGASYSSWVTSRVLAAPIPANSSTRSHHHRECIPQFRGLVRGITECRASTVWASAAATALAPAFYPPSERATMILVDDGGKSVFGRRSEGFEAAEHLSLWTTQSGINQRTWGKALRARYDAAVDLTTARLRTKGPGHGHQRNLTRGVLLESSLGNRLNGCGPCANCRAKLPAQHSRTNGRVHVLDPMRHALFRAILPPADRGGIAHVHALAASNVSTFKAGTGPGRAAIATTTLDGFVMAQSIPQAYLVDIMVSGGKEPLVLHGMSRLLQARKVEFLRFAYSRSGYWLLHGRSPGNLHAGAFRPGEHKALRATVGWLHQLANYKCFVEAGRALVPITGVCWQPAFETAQGLRGGHVVCAHRRLTIDLLTNLTWQEFQRRQKQTVDVMAAVMG